MKTFFTVTATLCFLCMLAQAAFGNAWWALFSAGAFLLNAISAWRHA